MDAGAADLRHFERELCRLLCAGSASALLPCLRVCPLHQQERQAAEEQKKYLPLLRLDKLVTTDLPLLELDRLAISHSLYRLTAKHTTVDGITCQLLGLLHPSPARTLHLESQQGGGPHQSKPWVSLRSRCLAASSHLYTARSIASIPRHPHTHLPFSSSSAGATQEKHRPRCHFFVRCRRATPRSLLGELSADGALRPSATTQQQITSTCLPLYARRARSLPGSRLTLCVTTS